jgi:hypothetical protein
MILYVLGQEKTRCKLSEPDTGPERRPGATDIRGSEPSSAAGRKQ